jgi:hypothetical protein
MGLNGKTPAGEAEIDLNLSNNKCYVCSRKAWSFIKNLISTTINAMPHS